MSARPPGERPLLQGDSRVAQGAGVRRQRLETQAETGLHGGTGEQSGAAYDGQPAQLQAKEMHQAVGAADAHEIAAQGVSSRAQSYPFAARIQASFGHHDISGVRAHTGEAAVDASRRLGAQAYTRGESVAFGAAPDLHTAAHESAHVVQQRSGVQLSSGVGRAGDSYERHADAVADSVVQGDSAEGLLDGGNGSNGSAAADGAPAVQMKAQDCDMGPDLPEVENFKSRAGDKRDKRVKAIVKALETYHKYLDWEREEPSVVPATSRIPALENLKAKIDEWDEGKSEKGNTIVINKLRYMVKDALDTIGLLVNQDPETQEDIEPQEGLEPEEELSKTEKLKEGLGETVDGGMKVHGELSSGWGVLSSVSTALTTDSVREVHQEKGLSYSDIGTKQLPKKVNSLNTGVGISGTTLTGISTLKSTYDYLDLRKKQKEQKTELGEQNVKGKKKRAKENVLTSGTYTGSGVSSLLKEKTTSSVLGTIGGVTSMVTEGKKALKSGKQSKALGSNLRKETKKRSQKLEKALEERKDLSISVGKGEDKRRITVPAETVGEFLDLHALHLKGKLVFERGQGEIQVKVGTDQVTQQVARLRYQALRENRAIAHYMRAKKIEEIRKYTKSTQTEKCIVSAINVAGTALNTAGTFTGGLDGGITKSVGKGIKAGVTVYKEARKGMKRRQKIKELSKLKTLVDGNKRGEKWRAKMFFVNVDRQLEKMRNRLEGNYSSTEEKGKWSGKISHVEKSQDKKYERQEVSELQFAKDERYARTLINLALHIGEHNNKTDEKHAREVLGALGITLPSAKEFKNQEPDAQEEIITSAIDLYQQAVTL